MTPPSAIRLELPEVDCALPVVVIADLHLDLADERGGREFALWLAKLRAVGTLAILGDLFDAWVGPAQERMPGALEVLDALKRVAQSGTQLLVVHGNRDFLLDASFEERTGARVLRDGFTTRLADGSRAAFVHGDTLCTKDVGYLRLRRVVRSKPVTWLAPRLPLFVGLSIARRLRRASVNAVAQKPSEEKSVQRAAAEALSAETGAELLVCGHVHAFRDEPLSGGARWIVLDAFGGQRDALTLSERAVVALATRDLAGRDCADLAVP
ncbi:MAG: UDP-2,3-diacylglucosamine diphosphatase [Planctomycetota bacterium]|nr:UDP-2,3-diacylglucosamine diphosphatase [Planctomycetota bacterium]